MFGLLYHLSTFGMHSTSQVTSEQSNFCFECAVLGAKTLELLEPSSLIVRLSNDILVNNLVQPELSLSVL